MQAQLRQRLRREHGFVFCDDPFSQHGPRARISDAVNVGPPLSLVPVISSSTDHETQVELITLNISAYL